MATFSKGIVYGNAAHLLGKHADGDHTHTWTVYLRSPHNEDLSQFVKKVQFKLHESFQSAVRTVEKPPYEVSESGWGEFDIQIKIFFLDSAEKPITLYHLLKLYPNDDTIQQSKKTIIAERYDELVFAKPSPLMISVLSARPSIGGSRRQAARDYEAEEERQLELMGTAKKRVGHLLRSKEQELQDIDAQLVAMKAEVDMLNKGKVPPQYLEKKK